MVWAVGWPEVQAMGKSSFRRYFVHRHQSALGCLLLDHPKYVELGRVYLGNGIALNERKGEKLGIWSWGEVGIYGHGYLEEGK